MALCKKLSNRCKELKMDIIDLSQTENRIFMQWEMTLMFKKFPRFTLYGCSKLTLNEEALIIEQRQRFSFW